MAWWEPMALALAMGTWAGIAHAAVVAYRQHVTHVFTWTSRDLPWMSPLGNAAILLAPALLALAVRVVRPRWGTTGLAVSLVGGAAILSVLLNFQGLHPAAVLALAAGVASQLGRLALVRPDRWRRGALLASIPSLLFTGVAFARARRDAPGPVGEAASDAPNVIVLILDTVRAASTSLHGYARETTPAVARVAGSGARFDWAISPSSWTLPSHGAIFTGHPAGRLSASWRRPLDTQYPTLAEALAGAGYRTGAFVANLFYTHHESGVTRGFQVVRDFRRSRLQFFWSTTLGQSPLVTRLFFARDVSAVASALRTFELMPRAEPMQDRRRASEVIDEFLAWEREGRAPFFAFVNLYDAHDPYEPPAGYRTRFAAAPGKRDLYDAGIRYMDDEVGRLVDALQRRGILDRTLLVVTADHGEQFGERGLRNHGNSLYLPAVHVPLVMRYPPRVPEGLRVAGPVSLTNLAATVLDVTGVQASAIPGTSWLAPAQSPVVSETQALDASTRIRAPAERGPLSAIFADSLQYIRNGDSTYQLLDIRVDDIHPVDLITTEAGCARAIELDAALRSVSPLPSTPALTPAWCDAHVRSVPR